MTKKEKLKKYQEELDALHQYMSICGYGMKDTMQKMALEDAIHELQNSPEEDSEEDSQDSEG